MVMRRKVQVFVYRTAPEFEVLLLKREKTDKGDWHPVTGNVGAHEQIRIAAMRETMEETGYDTDPEPLGITFTYEVKEGKMKGRYHETAFAAAVPADEEVELSEEHTAFEWVAPAAAREKLSWPDQQRALDALVERYAKRAA